VHVADFAPERDGDGDGRLHVADGAGVHAVADADGVDDVEREERKPARQEHAYTPVYIIVIIVIIVVWLVLEWTLPVSRATSMQEDLLMGNSSAEMFPVARQAITGKLGGRKPDNNSESPLWRPNTPNA